jgi:hypothetical protein
MARGPVWFLRHCTVRIENLKSSEMGALGKKHLSKDHTSCKTF